LEETPKDLRPKLLGAFNRTGAKMLRSGNRSTRKPIKVIAVNDMDESIVHGARDALDYTQSSICKFKGSAQLLFATLNPAIQIFDAMGCAEYCMRKSTRKMGIDIVTDMRTLGKFCEPLVNEETLALPLDDMYHSVVKYLVEQSTFDGGIYVADILGEEKGIFSSMLIGIAKEIREKTFTIDKKPRPAYGIGMLSHGDLKWLSVEYKGKKMPVYIQRHTIDRLIQRTAPICGSNSSVYITICMSISKPTICYENDREFLIECRIHDKKVGYFACIVCDDSILITTFLFLTMDGTPEGEKLWGNLRLGRYDKEYLGLDSLKLFVTSDLRSDTEITGLLNECGCGHLLSFNNENRNIVSGVADDIKNYLSINQKTIKQPLERFEFN
jgi:hypothetical protein